MLTDADIDEIFIDARERVIAWQRAYSTGKPAPYVQATNKALQFYAQPQDQPQPAPPETMQEPTAPAMGEMPGQMDALPPEVNNGMGLA